LKRPLRPAEQNRRERRRQVRRAVRAGAPPAPCALCGYFSSVSGILRPFRVSELAEPLRQKVLQRHHWDGEEVSDFIVWIDIWCHAEESDAKYDLPERLRHPRTREDRLLAVSAGNARMLRRTGEMYISRAEWEENLIRKMLAEEKDNDA